MVGTCIFPYSHSQLSGRSSITASFPSSRTTPLPPIPGASRVGDDSKPSRRHCTKASSHRVRVSTRKVNSVEVILHPIGAEPREPSSWRPVSRVSTVVYSDHTHMSQPRMRHASCRNVVLTLCCSLCTGRPRNSAQHVAAIILLSFVLALGFLLIILSCALWSNWLPLLVALIYVLTPLPNSLCARCAGADDFSADYNSGFLDFGNFMTGVMIVSGFALPLSLAHAGVIAPTACWMSIAGGGLVYGTILTYSGFFSESDEF